MEKTKKIVIKVFFIFVLLTVVIAIASPIMAYRNTNEITFSQFRAHLGSDKVKTINYGNNNEYITAELKNGTYVKTGNPGTEDAKNLIFNSNAAVKQSKSPLEWLGSLSNLLFFGIELFFAVSLFKTISGGGLNKSLLDGGINTDNQKSDTTFKDVAGCEESKEAMQELVYFLRNPEKYKKYGVKPPKGAILYGPPGTGKTLLAKALAGESGANFIAVTGSNFVDKFVGNGASRVRHLFAEAKKKTPCIIFIDEIDAVGGKRDAQGSHEERQQTLNELLSAMNGFSDEEGIIVIGATNRLESLDDALVRSGRFDTKIYVNLPNVSARKKIFEVHSKSKPIDKMVDFEQVAKMTSYFSGADIENVMNKAGFYAAKDESLTISMVHIDKAINTLIAGESKKDRTGIREEDKKLTAYHEAGHAVVAKLMCFQSVPKITIIPTTHGAGGYTLISPDEKMYKTKTEMKNEIAVSLGGRIAEELIYGKDNVTGGASADIRHVTSVALSMIKNYGMSEEFGMIALSDSSLYEKDVVQSAKKMVDEIYERTYRFVEQNRNMLDDIVRMLMDKETIHEKEFESLIKGIPCIKEDYEQLSLI